MCNFPFGKTRYGIELNLLLKEYPNDRAKTTTFYGRYGELINDIWCVRRGKTRNVLKDLIYNKIVGDIRNSRLNYLVQSKLIALIRAEHSER